MSRGIWWSLCRRYRYRPPHGECELRLPHVRPEYGFLPDSGVIIARRSWQSARWPVCRPSGRGRWCANHVARGHSQYSPLGADLSPRRGDGAAPFCGRVGLVRRDWQPEELIASWTLVDRDWELVANKTGATRLGFALLLKFFERNLAFATGTSRGPDPEPRRMTGPGSGATMKAGASPRSNRRSQSFHECETRSQSRRRGFLPTPDGPPLSPARSGRWGVAAATITTVAW